MTYHYSNGPRFERFFAKALQNKEKEKNSHLLLFEFLFKAYVFGRHFFACKRFLCCVM